MKDESALATGSRSHRRLHQALVVSELVLAQALLATADARGREGGPSLT